jgi:hypothetical protein
VLLIDLSILQQPVLLMDLYVLQQPMLFQHVSGF